MKEFMQKAVQKIVALTNAKYMRILTNGFMSIAAISIAGSIFTLIKSLPFTAWQNFLASSGWGELLSIPVSITSDLMAIYVVFAMAFALAKEFKKDGLSAAVVALGAFMILTPFTANVYNADYTEVTVVSDVLPISSLGAQGIFLAIITGLAASRLYIFFIDRGWRIKMPDSVPPMVAQMFEMMIPGGLTFLIFLAIRWGFSLTSFGTAQTFIYSLLQKPLLLVGGGLGGMLVFLVAQKLFWCFGVHGGMVAYAAMSAIIRTAAAENAAAFAAGTAAPHPEWAYMTMLMDFSILPLTLCMLLFARSRQYKSLARISLPTSLFNISEPLVFGFPLIMNPLMAIPFIGLEVVNLLLTMFVTNIGFLAAPTGASIASNIPTIIQGGLLTSSWTGFVWAAVLLVIDTLVWIPFFRIMDAKALKQEQMQESAEEEVQPELAAEAA